MIGVLAFIVCVVVAIESSITLEQRYATFQQAGMFPWREPLGDAATKLALRSAR